MQQWLTHPLLTPLVPLEVLLHWSGMSLTQSEAQASKTFVLTQMSWGGGEILFCKMVSELFAEQSKKKNLKQKATCHHYTDILWQKALSDQLRELKGFDLLELDLFARQVCQTGRRTKRWKKKSKATAACLLIGDASFDLFELCFEFQTILGSWSFARTSPLFLQIKILVW